ncbi:heme-binding protein [Rhodoferax sp.]|uniref:SOUL family heme-binding protein n=1 Tax=Rhodoferax sp. TaxID=50421 RepID=UPI0026045FD4|nr:heme-binding protein [Rhodoferax sp.]MDD5001280.1 heme-binding protein [Thiomonas arsenitoxydans]MDD5481216.1 heme-binding protein [Rhodoferax sp.]
MATEEPKFEVIAQFEHIELRRYPALLVAETWVDGDMDAASGKGFRAIADFIFGNNTAPGASAGKTSEKIAMTAPVGIEPEAKLQDANRWRVQFVMPSRYTLQTLPKPNNSAVQVHEVPAKTWAVLRYSGFNTEAGIRKRTDELQTWLAAQNITPIGRPQLARYNPPWTLPMFRRNEVMLEIETPPVMPPQESP